MKYESLDKIESKKEIEELNSIKYKGLNHSCISLWITTNGRLYKAT